MNKLSLAVSFAAISSFGTSEEKQKSKNSVEQAVRLHMWKVVKSKSEDLINPGNSLHTDVIMKKCMNLPSGRMIFTEPSREFIQVFEENGIYIEDIYLSGRPFDTAVISNKLLAVSYGEGQYVEVIDLKAKVPVQNFQWDTNCFGVSNYDKKLFVVIEGRGITVLDNSTWQTVRTIPLKINQKTFLTVSNDRIIFSNWIFNTVHCHDLNGDELWVFRNSRLQRPIGITTNSNGDIFVVGNISGNIFFIVADKTKHYELVRDKYLMDIDMDNKTSRLLALKSDGSAQKYFVEYL